MVSGQSSGSPYVDFNNFNLSNYRNDTKEIKLPPFWEQDPRMWFNQVESNFHQRNITNDAIKCHFVVGSLAGEVAQHISDIFEDPPNQGNSNFSRKN